MAFHRAASPPLLIRLLPNEIRNRSIESKHREHSAGFSFLDAVGIIAVQITCGARAGVVDVLNSKCTALPDNFRSEIDFVVRRTNTRAKLHDHVRGIGAEAFSHFSNRVCDNPKLGASPSGVHEPDGGCLWIHDVNSATVSDVNAKCDAALIRDDTIARWEFTAHRAAATAIDDCYFVSMDLL